MAVHERSAGFLLYHAAPVRRYLLLDYGRHWDFPKGHVEKGEDDLTAAWRELKEETGIDQAVRIDGFEDRITYFFRKPKKGLIRKTVVFFLAESAQTTVVLSHEHRAFAFLPFDEAIERVTYPNAKDLLRRAEQFLADRR